MVKVDKVSQDEPQIDVVAHPELVHVPPQPLPDGLGGLDHALLPEVVDDEDGEVAAEALGLAPALLTSSVLVRRRHL